LEQDKTWGVVELWDLGLGLLGLAITPHIMYQPAFFDETLTYTIAVNNNQHHNWQGLCFLTTLC